MNERKNFNNIVMAFISDLINNSYTFGRGEADYRFSKENFDKKLLPTVSKVHFR